jgi:hypothetical protein
MKEKPPELQLHNSGGFLKNEVAFYEEDFDFGRTIIGRIF